MYIHHATHTSLHFNFLSCYCIDQCKTSLHEILTQETSTDLGKLRNKTLLVLVASCVMTSVFSYNSL